MHINLLVEFKDGKPIKEPVHSEQIGKNHFKLLYSPGLVQGLAAGDEFSLVNSHGEFEVLKRGGNISVQVYSATPIAEFSKELCHDVEALGGVVDGNIEKGIVFTIPVSVGFTAIEKLFNLFVENNPNAEWIYGNIYDDKDKPLNWWLIE